MGDTLRGESHMSQSRLNTVVRKNSSIQIIVVTGILLWLSLMACRAFIVKVPFDSNNIFLSTTRIVAASYNDFVFVYLFTAVFAALAAAARRHAKIRTLVTSLYCVGAAVVAGWGIINIQTVELLGEPFTLPWLYYSDFLQTGDSLNGIFQAFNVRSAATVIGLVCAVVILGFAVGRAISRLSSIWQIAISGFGIFVVSLGLLFALDPSSKSNQFPPSKTANAVVAFADSAIVSRVPGIFTLSTPYPADDVRTVAERPPETSNFPRPVSNPIRNVIIVSIEDMSPDYIQTYGGTFPVTPNLVEYRADSLQFQNIYAPTPATNYSFVSLIASIYPNISWKSMTSEYPALPMTTIAGELSGRGYRTALFTSADNRFQSLDKFLQHRGFDLAADYRDIPCDVPIFKQSTAQWQNIDSTSDLCTSSALIQWLKSGPAQKPFSRC
jgi:lipoteichoic acid synthase